MKFFELTLIQCVTFFAGTALDRISLLWDIIWTEEYEVL
jgi:hypothetical protein